MQGLPQLVDRCAEDFISSFQNVWEPDKSGAEYDYQYGDAILQNLRDFETGLRAELRRRIATRLRQRNTCVPISKLPPELLQLIFRCTLITSSGNRARGYVRTMVSLRSVSWGWRALLERSPSLWGHVTSSDHPKFIWKALENSKEAPLHLTSSRKERDVSHSAFLDKMVPHLHRWESISIHNPTQEEFAKYFTSRAPVLKRVALWAASEWEPRDPACPFSGLWSFLEELQIRRWRNIELRGVQLGQLRVLDIGLCESLEISQILRLIQENQQHLETLRLEDITFTSSTPFTHSNAPVVLSNLKDLTLSELRFADSSNVDSHFHHPTLHILRHTRFPSCTKFTLHIEESESTVDPEELQSLLPSPLDILAHSSPRGSQTSQTTRGYLQADFSSHGLSLTVDQEPGCEFKYEVELDDIPRSITTRWLKSALEDKPGVTLQEFKLHIYIYEDSHMDDLVAFQASEAVTVLSVKTGDAHLRDEVERRLLQMLATPCISASGATVMAFPRLLTVEFEGWGHRGQAIQEMIRNRFGTPGVEAHRPDYINIKGPYGYREFLWDNLGDIHELYRFRVIHFGAIHSWPSSSPRPGSPESVWPPSDDEACEDECHLDPETEEEEGSLLSAETDDS